MGCGSVSTPSSVKYYSPPLPKQPLFNDIEIMLKTLESNIKTDYEGDWNQQNLINVLSLFEQVFTYGVGHQNQSLIYGTLKDLVNNEDQLYILHWIETKRSRKYSTIILPQCQVTDQYRDVKLCPTSDSLKTSRMIHPYNKDIIKEQALLEGVQMGKSYFSIEEIEVKSLNNQKKKYLCRKRNNAEMQQTPWIAEKTKDARYIWRGDIDLDKENVQYLLKFILTRRNSQEQCPSILINAGSHGGSFGKNAHSTGNFSLTEIKIYEQTMDTISRLLELKDLKLTKQNIRLKIYVHKLSSDIRCIYPLFADHIIDVQCSGAFEKVLAEYIVPQKSQHQQNDLMFLDTSHSEQQFTGKKNFESETKYQGQKNFRMNEPTEPTMKLNSSSPIYQFISDSAIIKSEEDARKIIRFFVPRQVVATKLLFRASEYNFNIKRYFEHFGSQTSVLLICITNKNKVIGAYSPLAHEWTIADSLLGGQTTDDQKDHLYFL